MSLDKAIHSGKEHRKPYRKAQAVDRSCRPHGECSWCRDARLFDRQNPATRRIRDAVRREIAQALDEHFGVAMAARQDDGEMPDDYTWNPFEDAPLTAVRFRVGDDDAPWGPWIAL
jgi:hypothetical protein